MLIRHLQDRLEELRRRNHKEADTLTRKEQAALHEEIKGVMQEINTRLAEGASPCPGCGNLPLVVQKSPWVWEAGCTVCSPAGGKQPRVRGVDREGVVLAWNSGKRMDV